MWFLCQNTKIQLDCKHRQFFDEWKWLNEIWLILNVTENLVFRARLVDYILAKNYIDYISKIRENYLRHLRVMFWVFLFIHWILCLEFNVFSCTLSKNQCGLDNVCNSNIQDYRNISKKFAAEKKIKASRKRSLLNKSRKEPFLIFTI